MEATKEELKAAFKELLSEDGDFRRDARELVSSNRPLNPEARAFKHKCSEWFRTNTTDWVGLQNGFNVLLRVRLSLKNVQQLRDNQVPAAEKLFEGYKQLIEGR